MKGRILWKDELSAVDITDGVQVLYDLVISSQNFGSGFWTIEDLEPVARVAEMCEFARSGDVRKYIDDQKHYYERQRWQNEHMNEPRPADILTGIGTSMGGLLGGQPVPHDHVYSSVGRCMWPRCLAAQTEQSR